MSTNKHLDTSLRLARHLRSQGYHCWVEAQRVGKWTFGDSPRVDVFAIKPWSGKDTEAIAFEVKVSTADLQRDLAAGKWRAYYETLGIPRVIVACGHGVIPNVSDFPPDLGLWFEDVNGLWKRKSMGRKMHADLRHLDPLLLMWCLSMNGDQTSGIRHREKLTRAGRIRLMIPAAALKIIDAESLGRDHRTRSILEAVAKKHGEAITAKVNDLLYGNTASVIDRIEKWAIDVIRAAAEASNTNPNELLSTFQSGHYLSGDLKHLAETIRTSIRFKHEADRIERIAYGLEALASGWRKEDNIDQLLSDAELAATPPPTSSVTTPCANCRGTGRMRSGSVPQRAQGYLETPCPSCRGTSVVPPTSDAITPL